MSDSNTVADQIDRMVAGSATNPGPGTRTTADMRIDENGNVTITQPRPFNAPVVDSPGIDLGAQVTGIESEIARIQGELDEVTHDSKTGLPSPVHAGRDRETRHAQLVSLKAARDFQLVRNAQIQAQREAGRAAQLASDAERVARWSFTQGEATKEKMLDEALARAEATEAAAAILRARRGQ